MKSLNEGPQYQILSKSVQQFIREVEESQKGGMASSF